MDSICRNIIGNMAVLTSRTRPSFSGTMGVNGVMIAIREDGEAHQVGKAVLLMDRSVTAGQIRLPGSF